MAKEMTQRVVIIVQARMGSRRLPGKVLMEVLGRPLLAYELERLQRVKRADEIIVATTKHSMDDPIVSLCDSMNIATYRGSEYDVLSRYLEAGHAHHADIIVRITADCPLIDPNVIDKGIEVFLEKDDEYVSNCNPRSYPRGMDTEIFTIQALESANIHGVHPLEREHVTYYLYSEPGRCRVGNFEYESDLSSYHFTVDTQEDFDFIRSIVEGVYPKNPHFTLEDIITFVEQ